eukprot:3934175-Rhodomonas_salina.2
MLPSLDPLTVFTVVPNVWSYSLVPVCRDHSCTSFPAAHAKKLPSQGPHNEVTLCGKASSRIASPSECSCDCSKSSVGMAMTATVWLPPPTARRLPSSETHNESTVCLNSFRQGKKPGLLGSRLRNWMADSFRADPASPTAKARKPRCVEPAMARIEYGRAELGRPPSGHATDAN